MTLTQNTPVKLTIGALILLVGNIVTVVTEHVTTRRDLDDAVQEIQTLHKVIEEQQRAMNQMKLDQGIQNQRFLDFLGVYDHDFNRYIRERGDRPATPSMRGDLQ